ncbi:S8 family serine peptidase [Actinomycetes bacterium KLBMP 9797]
MVAAGIAVPAAPAAAAECLTAPGPGQVVAQTPVEQLVLAARRVWPTTTGQAVTVAVVDTGVDSRHPQLRGAVRQGWDFVENEPGGTVDCSGHGTAVAGLVGARVADRVGFAGIAPGVTILPVRVTERLSAGELTDPAPLAAGIRWAADQGADVIAVSLVAARATEALRAAVAHAVSRDALVVAAAGTRASAQTASDPPSYPAGYPGVLGIGAVDPDGARLASSPLNSTVDIVAPGAGVLTTAPARGHTPFSGTGAATPLVAATAALVRSAHPRLGVAEVTHRLLATANPVAGGAGSAAYGAGMADPARAVTEVLSDSDARGPAGMPVREVDERALRREAQWRSLTASALAIAAAIVLILLGCAALVGLHRRLRRPPRPALSTADHPADADLAELFFTPPTPPRPSP